MAIIVYPPTLIATAVSGTSVTPTRLTEMVSDTARPDLNGMLAQIRDAVAPLTLAAFATTWAQVFGPLTAEERLVFLRVLAAQVGASVFEIE